MWNGLKKLLTANPLGIFIWGIIAKWYIMILVASVVVLFWTLKGLEKAKVFDKAEKTFSAAMSDVKNVAKYCVPKIMDLKDFWNCLENPQGEEPDQEDLQDVEAFEKKEDAIREHFFKHKTDTKDGPQRGTEDVDPYEKYGK